MPRKKKHLKDLTTEEALKYLFPKKVRKELTRVANELYAKDSKRKSKRDKE